MHCTTHRTTRCTVAMIATSLFLTAGAVTLAQEDGDEPFEPRDSAAAGLAAARAVESSFVEVRYWLRMDKGKNPVLRDAGSRCASCGRYHGRDTSELIEEQRPLERPGLLVAPTGVVTADLSVEPRFVERIEVRHGTDVVPARPSALALERSAVFLELDAPLPHAVALDFGSRAGETRYAVSCTEAGGRRRLTTHTFPGAVVLEPGSAPRPFGSAPYGSLLVDEHGRPVTIHLGEGVALDDSGRTPPTAWRTLPRSDLDRRVELLQGRAGGGLVRVQLSFRSPDTAAAEPSWAAYGDDDENPGELSVAGVLVSEDTVLVLANLTARLTARLERIRLEAAAGEMVAAAFVASLSDYGALIARSERPLPGALPLAERDPRELRDELLLLASLEIFGEQRVLKTSTVRLTHTERGRWDKVYPRIGGGADGTAREFLFDRDGRLLAIPLEFRLRADENTRYRASTPELIPVSYLRGVFADPASHADTHNVPLSEAEENRLAWLGVELQPLDEDLARINGVSEQTYDGSTGAMVTWVYDESPARGGGIELGDILLRIHPESYPRAIEAQVEDDYGYFEGSFPWEELGSLPEEYFSEIPAPWPPAGSWINRTLTELGLGTKYRLELARDGTTVSLPFVVAEMPPHFQSAAKHRSEALGLTVREMTYEVRRYFRKTSEDPGLVIAKIEPGSRAAVAGLKPYEIITQIDATPLFTVADFAQKVAGGGELRLSVRRMDQGRVVKIVAAPASAPEADVDTDAGADEDPGADAGAE